MSYYIKSLLPDEICEHIDSFIGICSTQVLRLNVLQDIMQCKIKKFKMSNFRLDCPENQQMEQVKLIHLVNNGFYAIKIKLSIDHSKKVCMSNFPYNNRTLIAILRRILNECGLDGNVQFESTCSSKSKICNVNINDLRPFKLHKKRVKYSLFNYIYSPINEEMIRQNRDKIFKVTI